MSYNRCICQGCGNNFATTISSDTELQKEKCPSCGERSLKISGKLSHSELATQSSGGGG